jgi:hypothetical protein
VKAQAAQRISIFRGSRSVGMQARLSREDAVEFLANLLANGPRKVTQIEKEARAACLLGQDQAIGQSKPFRSARKTLGIESYQPKGQKAGGWLWALPKDQVPLGASDALTNTRASDGYEGI